MATITTSAEFAGFVETPEAFLPGLTGFNLDFQDQLNQLDGPIEWEPVSAASNRIVLEGEGPGLAGTLTVTITGSGIGPLASFEQFEQAIMDGLATGTLNRVDFDLAGTQIARLDMAAAGYTITSGAQSLSVQGALPTTLQQLGALTQVLSLVESEMATEQDVTALFNTLGAYRIDGLSLSNGGTELASVTLSNDTLTVVAEGYTLSFTGNLPTIAELEAAALAMQGTSWDVTVAVRDANGVELFSNTGEIVTHQFGAPATGRYYVSIEAGDGKSVGDYELISWGNGTGSVRLTEGADAAAGINTSYSLQPPAFAFNGSLDPAGDSDWVALDLTAGERAFLQGYFMNVDDGFADLFDIHTVTITNPAGDEMAGIRDIDGLDDLLAALESLVGPLFPPALPQAPGGWVTGDPHLLTMDGAAYDFHAAGEYVLLRGTDFWTSDFEVQARMAPVGDNVTANVAIAVATDGGPVMVDATDPNPLWINGVNVEMTDGMPMSIGDDKVYRQDNIYTIVLAGMDGEVNDGDTQIAVRVHDGRVDVNVSLGDGALFSNVEGLLGNADGNPDNDIALADGTPLDRPLAFDDLYGQYRDDWRVTTEGQSLFTYDQGESVDGFYLPNYPTGITTVADFDAAKVTAAQAAVTAAGLQPGSVNYENAVLDFLLTGDDSYIDSAQDTPTAPQEAAAPVDATGGLSGLVTLTASVAQVDGDNLSGGTARFVPTGATVALIDRDTADGQYDFKLAGGESGRLDVTRAWNKDQDPVIDASDALNVLRMAVGLDPSWGEADGFNFIAADVNRDGQITAADALEILRVAVGLEADNMPQWVGFADDADLSGLTAQDVDVESGVDIAALQADMNVNMTAILLGNMEEFV